jgi:Domain of unknown function (DUF3883)
MSIAPTYNDDEVQELFEVVFKLSAKDINDKLKKVANRPEIAMRRWFWELLQNAKDAVKQTEKVSVKLVIGSEKDNLFLEFFHNGNPFRYSDAKNLIFPYSDKEDEEDSDNSGRFGTGFLATHILAKKIRVKGIYLKEQQAFDFTFTLDRTGADKPAIAESISFTWQEFREKRKETPNYVYDQKNFETSFRYDLQQEDLPAISESINDFCVSLPFTLAFIPKIGTIEINNQIEGMTTFFEIKDKKDHADNIKQYTIEKRIIKNGKETPERLNLIICSDGIIDVAVEILEKGKTTFIKEFLPHQPLLFCSFPLIGANNFKFPIVVNSSSFTPKEERDGIWLENAGYGPANQKLFEKATPLYIDLCNYASAQNWKNTHLLLTSLNEKISMSDFNAVWFKDKIQKPIKDQILSIPLVDISNGKRVPLTSVNFPHEAQDINRMQLWSFIRKTFPDKVPLEKEVHDWYKVIWEDCPGFTINTFTRHIAGFKNLATLQTALDEKKSGALKWLNDYVTFIMKVAPILLNAPDTLILPNQFGHFKKKDDLWLDDDTIDLELKEILGKIASITKKVQDWRNDMLEKKIYLDLPATRTRTLAMIGTTITDLIKELLKEDNPGNDLKDLFSQLLNWLSEHPDQARNYFKGLRSETLLYKTANESKIKYVTEMLQRDRTGELSLEKQFEIMSDPKKVAILSDPQKVALLSDPEWEVKLKLGEQVLADFKSEKAAFIFKKETGDIFEKFFHRLINTDDQLDIKKVEGEEDFIITNKASGHQFYIELKSIRSDDRQIQMTHKQAKKASNHPSNYFLCIIPNDGNVIDEAYFKAHARFDGTIGTKLSHKIGAALAFEAPEEGITVEFEDDLLRSYNKYRYKFTIQHLLWGKDDFDTFRERLR